jgi:hypothetical protein
MYNRLISCRSIFLLILFFQVQFVFSQKNYIEGYIVKKNSDTIKGLIDYRNWEKNPHQVSFKETKTSPPSIYKAQDLIEFSVAGENYKGGIFSVDKSSYKMDELDYSPNYIFTADTVFLRTLIAGEKSLYYYNDNTGKDHFFIRNNGSYELLLYKLYLKDIAGKPTLVTDKSFIRQLVLYLGECANMDVKVAAAEYKMNDLHDLFDGYYRCKGKLPAYRQGKEKAKTEFGILAGLTITHLKVIKSGGSTHLFDYLTKAKFSTSAGFTGGIFFNVILARNLEKWAVNNEILYSSYKINGHYSSYVSQDDYSNVNTTLGFSYLKLNSILRYKITMATVNLFLKAGVSNGVVIHQDNYKKEVSKFYLPETTKEGKALDEIRKYEQGYLFGLEARLDRFSVEARYEKANGMENYGGLRSPVSRIHFLFSYKL